MALNRSIVTLIFMDVIYCHFNGPLSDVIETIILFSQTLEQIHRRKKFKEIVYDVTPAMFFASLEGASWIKYMAHPMAILVLGK